MISTRRPQEAPLRGRNSLRLPLTDAEGAVVGYELVVVDSDAGARATAALLLDAFGDVGLEKLAGRHPAWCR